jgi:hypothetical protein
MDCFLRKKKKQMVDLVVRFAASVVLAKFPDRPEYEHMRSAKDFFSLLSKLFGLAKTKPDTRSRDHLTSWAMSNFLVWRDADYAAASPKRWGPYMWSLMLRCAQAYTPRRRTQFRAWLKSLRYLLPCLKCAGHYKRMLANSKSKWKRVRTSTQFVDYVEWMRAKVRRRVQTEQKLLSRRKYKNYFETWPVRHVA